MSHTDSLWNYEFIACCNSCIRIDYQGYVYMHTPDSLCQQHSRIVKEPWFPVAKDAMQTIFNRFNVADDSRCAVNLRFQYCSNCAAFAVAGYFSDSSLPYKRRIDRWKFLQKDKWWREQKKYGLSSHIIKVTWRISHYHLYYLADPLLVLYTRLRDRFILVKK